MRNIIFILILFGIFAIVTSCEEMFGDFLDKAPGVDVTEDTIFSNQRDCETFIAGMYSYGTVWDDYEDDARYMEAGTWDAATYAGEETAAWFFEHVWNSSNITPSNARDGKFNTRFTAIRKANTVLENIDEVQDADQLYKDNARGEALFIRALVYFDMFRFYGGVPLIDKRNSPADKDYLIKRSSVKETVEFIVKDCEEAMTLLPDFWPDNYTGRATKGAAMMLKGMILLYAASPQFNTATPYLDLPGNNELICYGNADPDRWKLAADAFNEVLLWAPTGKIALVNNPGEVNKNYQNVWEKNDNSEIIFTKQYKELKGPGSNVIRVRRPPPFYSGLSGVTPTLNFVKLYRKANGTEQPWNMNGGNDLNQIYTDMEPRFKQTIAYNGSYWNIDYQSIQLWEADPANNVLAGLHKNKCYGGHWMKKGNPEATRQNPVVQICPFETIFRLGETYVYYAEALNEWYPSPPPEAYNAINIIRGRGGLPPLAAGLTKDQFRAEIQREIAIEIAFENCYFWDLRRWLKAAELNSGPMYGIQIYRIPKPAPPYQYRYTTYVFETRTFLPKLYLHPWPQNEVDKKYFIQNPGY